MLGQEIEEVYVHGANTGAASDNEVLDLQVIQLRLTGGCLANTEVYVNAGYGYEVGLEVVGDAGAVQTAPADAPVLRKQRYAGYPRRGRLARKVPGRIRARDAKVDTEPPRRTTHRAGRVGRLRVASCGGELYRLLALRLEGALRQPPGPGTVPVTRRRGVRTGTDAAAICPLAGLAAAQEVDWPAG